MRIRNIRHRGLRQFIEHDDPSGLHPDTVEKLRRMITYLEAMGSEDELRTISIWRAHKLQGDRKGTWSLFVLRNWRLTFRIDRSSVEILDLDYEDYH